MVLRVAFFFALFTSAAFGASPHKEPVTFTYTGDVGFGNSVFVVGNLADVGNWDVTHAIKLHFTPGNVWTGQVAIQAGAELQYRFTSRSTANSAWCNSGNVTYLTPDLFRTIPAQPDAPYQGKTIYYLSGWNPPSILYNNNGTFTAVPMRRVGNGRSAGESFYKVSGLGEAGAPIEFVFTDGNGSFDNPPGGGNYLTDLDVFQMQDGNVFSYQPPATVSPPQIITASVGSLVTGIAGRDVHVYLPRGYTQNTGKRYPVLYLHDGQNVFDPATAFQGREWQADETATREIGQGRMRETIMVGIDNTNQRIAEYTPPNDSYVGTQGRGDGYASFVINHVRPYLDFNYRTLNDPKNTLVLGSSLGGLISLYMGREFSTFGKIGVFSPAFWIAPNYITQVQNGSKKPLRLYLDFGTAEPADDWDNALSMYDVHLGQDYAANDDVTFIGGCGEGHDELAWRARLPAALRYLLPAREEPGELVQREFPSKFEITGVQPGSTSATFYYSALFGFTYTLERSPDLQQWSSISTTAPEPLPWAYHSLGDIAPPADPYFWKLTVTPTP